MKSYQLSQSGRRVLLIAAILVVSTFVVFALTNSFSEPVEMVVIDEGIKMEVVAVGFYDNMAMAYITLQDMEGDRIDESTNIGRDLFVYNGDDFCPSQIDFVDFDESTGTITYLVTALAVDNVDFGSVTFSNEKIYYGARSREDCRMGVDLKALTKPETIDVPIPQASDIILILKPSKHSHLAPDNPTSWITGVGVIDQKLHVQTWRNTSEEGAYTAYYLSDGTDKRIYPEATFMFNFDEQGNVSDEIMAAQYMAYEELIFPVLPNLSDLQLLSYYYLEDVLYGQWSITVENHQVFEPLKEDIHIETGDFTYESISINPFGMTMRGARHNRYAGLDMPEVIVHTEDGDVILEWENAKYPEDAFEATYKSPKPIDIRKIKSVTIEGTTILL